MDVKRLHMTNPPSRKNASKSCICAPHLPIHSNQKSPGDTTLNQPARPQIPESVRHQTSDSTRYQTSEPARHQTSESTRYQPSESIRHQTSEPARHQTSDSAQRLTPESARPPAVGVPLAVRPGPSLRLPAAVACVEGREQGQGLVHGEALAAGWAA